MVTHFEEHDLVFAVETREAGQLLGKLDDQLCDEDRHFRDVLVDLLRQVLRSALVADAHVLKKYKS